MSGKRLALSHWAAEDRGPESGAPVLSRTRGQMVQGFATLYIAKASGWLKIPPGRLDVAEILGGASGLGNHDINIIASRVAVPQVEFYLDVPTRNHPKRITSYVSVNRAYGEIFTFGFFGRRFS